MKRYLFRALDAIHSLLLNSFVSRWYCAIIISPRKYKRVKLNGTNCVFHIPNSYINWYVSNFDSKFANELVTQEILLSCVRSGDVVYDVGANIGAYVIWLGKSFNLKQLVAFEPEAVNYSELTKNIRINNLDTAVAMPLAASNRSGYEPFFLQDEMEGNASSFLGDYEASDRSFSSQQIVPLEKIDSLVSSKIIFPPDVLLIDVDGGELSVLEGMQENLYSCRLVIVEVSEDTKNEVDIFLKNHDFYMKYDKNQRRGNITYFKNNSK